MTVKELIDELSKVRPDALVMFPWREIEARDVTSVGQCKQWNKLQLGREFYAVVLNDDTEPRT